MTHLISCDCGRLKGTLQQTGDINRCVCYCTDCQAFAGFLERRHDILDAHGGTDVIQTIPRYVSFTEGVDQLACMRLTDKGLLRWYAACCNTPIGNTPPDAGFPFVGLVHTCLRVAPASLDTAFGPARMYTSTKEAVGAEKPKAKGVVMGILKVMRMVARARINGSYQQNPFFIPGTKTPIATPKILNGHP